MLVFTLSTGHKLGLGLIALLFVGYALVTSMVIPRRYPGFPGRHLTGFVLVTIVLFGSTLFGVFWFGREAKGEIGTKESVPAETAPTPQSGGSTPAPTTSESTTTGSTTTSGGGGADLAAGKKVFADAGCGGCHTLADAGASGTVGPNLDDLKPSEDRVATQVRNGGSVMPAFGDRLSDAQIQAVAHYVATVAGNS
jgi:mono/diheme cytochrome c family protein